MEKIVQYQELCNIQPQHRALTSPLYMASPYNLERNREKIILHYIKQFDLWISDDDKQYIILKKEKSKNDKSKKRNDKKRNDKSKKRSKKKGGVYVSAY